MNKIFVLTKFKVVQKANTYNSLNQPVKENDTVYKYDDAGNLISTTSSGKSAAYTYNAENKLIRATVQEGNNVSVEEYEYDYAGNRTVKKSENDYTYYLNDVSGSLTQVLAELDADGNERCCYTRGIEIISQERSGNISYYLTDGHGSVRQLADSTGAVTDTYVYDAWGNLISSTGDTENSYLYCGEQLDSATGLYYLRARYMNPSTGTFISMDTYQGSIFEPATLHKYLYANANPAMYTDPSGYFTASEQSVTMSIMGTLNDMASSAASFAWNYYLKFKASMPMIIAAATGMAAFISNSPAFMDICARFASGDLTAPELCNQIIETFNNIEQSVWDHIYEATNRSHGSSSSGSSSGGSGSSGNFDPNKLQELINKLRNKVNDISQRKLQHEYKHAKDFGIEGNWNSKNGDQFYEAILEHIKNAPQTINGTYRGSGVVHYFNPASQVDVMVDLQNNFVCGWKLSPDQVSYLLSTGNIC